MRSDIAKFIDIFNYSDKENLENDLQNASKENGTCIFIDLCNSTEIKYKKSYRQWVIILNNTFNKICDEKKLENNIIKYIGDEVMIFIPDSDLSKGVTVNNYVSLLDSIYDIMDTIDNYNEDGFTLKCKTAIHYCTDVLHISFNHNTNDYYGIDIDLTARLMSRSKENRIVMSDKFYQRMKTHDKNQVHNMSVFDNISEKYLAEFKGVPEPTTYRIIDIK